MGLLEQQVSSVAYIDVEMNSLEDAYINIAKAEEKLHEGDNLVPEFLRDDDLENNEMFKRYLTSFTDPSFFVQT